MRLIIGIMNKETFLKRLRNLMDEKGITQYALAKGINARTNTVNNWFRRTGAVPRPKYLLAIAEFLNVSPAYLLYGDEKYAPKLKDDIMLIAEHIEKYLTKNPGDKERVLAVIKTLTTEHNTKQSRTRK